MSNASNIEHTLVLIKPDAIKNSLSGYVLSQLSEYHSGLRFAGLKVAQVSVMLAEEHYAEHKGKGFYPSLIEFITGRIHYKAEPANHRVIAIVYRGVNAVKKTRDLVGPTDPHKAREERPGCIRSLGTVVPILDKDGNKIDNRIDNLVHASANPEDAEREIKLWFKPTEIPPFMRGYATAQAEHNYFLKDGKLVKSASAGAICFLPKGEDAWASDLKALESYLEKGKASITLEAVLAKYLINRAD